MLSFIFNSKGSSSAEFTKSFLILICILSVSFSVSSEILIHKKVIPNHNYYKYLNLFRNSASRNAAFGDSQMANGFAGVPNFVNLAYGGDDVQNIRTKLIEYFNSRKPGRVVLQAGLHHFSYQYVRRVGRDDSFLEYLKNPGNPFPALLHPLHRRELFNYWGTLLSGRDFTPRVAFAANGFNSSAEDFSQEPSLMRAVKAGRIAAERAPLEDFENTENAKAYFDMLKFLTRKHANVCLVSLPVSKELYDAMQGFPDYYKVRQFYRDMAEAYGANYVDIHGQVLDASNFADANHLNIKGAEFIGPEIVERCFGTRPVS